MAARLEESIGEDTLIQGLIEAKGHRIEIIAFGIAYAGTLKTVDLRGGFVTVVDGDDRATLEFERIESFRTIE